MNFRVIFRPTVDPVLSNATSVVYLSHNVSVLILIKVSWFCLLDL